MLGLPCQNITPKTVFPPWLSIKKTPPYLRVFILKWCFLRCRPSPPARVDAGITSSEGAEGRGAGQAAAVPIRRGSSPAVATRSGSGDTWTCRQRPLLPDSSACEPPEEGFASPRAVMPLCSGARSVMQLAAVMRAEAG